MQKVRSDFNIHVYMLTWCVSVCVYFFVLFSFSQFDWIYYYSSTSPNIDSNRTIVFCTELFLSFN